MARDTKYDHFKKNKSSALKGFRHYLEYIGAKFLKKFAGLWGVRANQRAGACLGLLGYYLAKKDRGIAKYQLDFCFPDLSEKEKKKMIKETFMNLGRTLFEALILDKIGKDADAWVKTSGSQAVHDALKPGKGAVMLFSHTGNWELAGVVFEMLNLYGSISYKPVGAEKLNQFLVESRRSPNIDLIPVGDRKTAKLILNCFKSGKIFLMAIDQDANIKNTVFVDFFGRPAATPRGAAVFAQKFDLPVISAFGARMEDGGHRFFFKLLSQGPYQKGEREIRSLTQTYSAELEKHIRKFPSQWVWFHRRWKNQPGDK